MTVRPGARLVWLLGLLAVWSLVGLVWPSLLWSIPLVLGFALLAAAVDYRRLSHALAATSVHRRIFSPVARDKAFPVTLDISIADDHVWSAEVRQELPAPAIPALWIERVELPQSGRVSICHSIRIPLRGRYDFGPIWIRLRGSFGLLEAQKALRTSEKVDVYPENVRSEEALAQDTADELRLLDKLKQSRQRGVGTEFESLTEFRPGDDPRRIDWRTSARYRRPIVRRYQIERHRDLIVLVDCGRLMGADARQGTKLDCAVDAALRLMRTALRVGDRCGLGIFDNQVRGYLRPIGGMGAMQTFLASLYAVESRWHESDFSPMFATIQARQPKRALIIVLSDIVDEETSRRYRASLVTLAQRHVVLLAALQTPLFGEFVAAPVKSVDDGFKKAVVFRVLREREQAIHQLRRTGVHVLDVEPKKLTAPLINQFIELRQSNLL
jgi:uncharacterized protein (DUF58 family)